MCARALQAVAIAICFAPSVAPADQPIDQKAAVSGVITGLGPTRAEVEKRILERRSTAGAGEGVVVRQFPASSQEFLSYGTVSANGTLVGFNQKWGVVVVLDPLYGNGAVTWRCKVFPPVAAPQACK